MPRPVIIEPGRRPIRRLLTQLYQYRELLWILAWRDVRVRYAQTAVGLLWAFLNPAVTLLVLTFVFGTVAQVPTNGIPHPVYTLAGMCGWTYFANVFSQAGSSIIGAQDMVKKVYFPRLIIPLSKAIVAFIDFGIVLLLLLILMLSYGLWPSSNVLWLPFFILVAVAAGLVGGIWLSALTIRYRDFQHVAPLLIRVGMFATPIAYPASAVPDAYQPFYFLNPMAGVVEGFRWSLLGGEALNPLMYLSFGLLLLLLIGGLFYFNTIERTIADIL
ncbi:MAG: ABC transporter permease [Bacteroidota bacterium]